MTEKLRTDMLTFNLTCGFLQLLVPSVDVAVHDHTYISNTCCSDSLHEAVELS